MRIALPATIAPGAWTDIDPHAAIVDLHGETMGTTWRVKIVPTRSTDTRGVHDMIVARLAALSSEMSHWDVDSLLSRFNRAPADTWIALPADFAAVVAAGLDIAERSGGAFDPAIGEVVNLWGLGPVATSEPPDEGTLCAALGRSGSRRLAFEPDARRLRQPGGLALDLSGIAKGYAVDAVVAMLQSAGLWHCLVEIGGELAGRGLRPDGDPWWVDLEDPPGVMLAPLRIALHGLAVATSGNYRRGDHTIDPRAGHPVASGIVSVSVIHPDAMIADAWATALIVLGADAAMTMSARHGIAARIVAIVEGAAEERLTPTLDRMFAD